MKTHPTALPLLLFALLAALLVSGYLYVRSLEHEFHQSQIDSVSTQVSARLEQYMEGHFDRVVLMGQQLLLKEDFTEAGFRESVQRYQARYPGLQALNWIDPEGTIRWVEPLAPNRLAAGANIYDHPQVAPADALRAAHNSDGVAVSAPIQLFQGGWGFAAYYHLVRGGQSLGFLNVVFRLDSLLNACLEKPADRRFVYLLNEGDLLLGELGPRVDDHGELPIARKPVLVADRELSLTVIGAPQLMAAQTNRINQAQLVVGLLLAAALALLLRLAIVRRRQAEIGAERFRVLFENAPNSIFVIDADSGEILEGNERARHLLGWSANNEEFRSLLAMSPARQPGSVPPQEFLDSQFEAARNGERPVFEWALRDVAGRPLLTEVRLVSLPGPGPRRLLRASLTDITAQRELEIQLRRAQALEAMGKLAGGVAHDFNNLLTAILGSCELIVDRGPPDSEVDSLARGAVEACQRAAKLTRQLLAFSRHSALEPVVMDINSLVEGLLPMLKRVMTERIRLDTRLEASSPILADRSQIELVVLNLVINARDAIPDGGCITIETRDTELNGVSLAVSDDGEGIPEQLIERVFEPFFTTKKPGVGTGIGLATVKQIVDHANGYITVDSTPGVGTRFRAVFPAAAGDATEVNHMTPARLPVGQGVILFVEDDDQVRVMMRQALETAGYKVLAAVDAEAAQLIVRNHKGSIDLLITDAVLPNMSGIDLIDHLRRERPQLPALLVSGYSSRELPSEVAGTVGVLSKPFLPSTLIGRVREIFR